MYLIFATKFGVGLDMKDKGIKSGACSLISVQVFWPSRASFALWESVGSEDKAGQHQALLE